jgi:DNA mismatch repair ATPase MutL
MINGIPDFTKEKDAIWVITWIIEDLWEEKIWKMRHLEEVKNKFFAYTACRGSVKFGHKLNLFEMNKLLKDWAIYYSSTCPHGRPVSYDMNMDELMKKFAR